MPIALWPIPTSDHRMTELPYVTVRLGYMGCAYFNANIGTATVRAEHRAFYSPGVPSETALRAAALSRH